MAFRHGVYALRRRSPVSSLSESWNVLEQKSLLLAMEAVLIINMLKITETVKKHSPCVNTICSFLLSFRIERGALHIQVTNSCIYRRIVKWYTEQKPDQ